MKLQLIICLGNPGAEYENTYHNVGLQFAAYANREENRGHLNGITIVPSPTFMNESGAFVAKTIRKLGVTPEELLIVHDDSDLTLGSIKLSFERGAGGHHGVESVIRALKTDAFSRLRIGIRPASEKTRVKAGSFVLKKINKEAKEILEKTFQEALEKVLELVSS